MQKFFTKCFWSKKSNINKMEVTWSNGLKTTSYLKDKQTYISEWKVPGSTI